MQRRVRDLIFVVSALVFLGGYVLVGAHTQLNDMQRAVDASTLAVAQIQGVVDTQTQMNILLDTIIADAESKLSVTQMVELRNAIWEQVSLYSYQGLTPARVLAVIKQESAFWPIALSNRDAYGLMQVTVHTGAAHLSPEMKAAVLQNPELLFDIALNVRVGVAELMSLHALYVGRGLEELSEFHLSHTAYFWGYAGTNRMLATNGEHNPRLSLGYANSVRGIERAYRAEGLD